MAHKTPGSIVYAAIFFQKSNNKDFVLQVDVRNRKDFETSHSDMLWEVVGELNVKIRSVPDDPLKYTVDGFPYEFVYIMSRGVRRNKYLYCCVAKRTYRMRICKNFLDELAQSHLKEMRGMKFPKELKGRIRGVNKKDTARLLIRDIMKKHNNPLKDPYIRGFHLMQANKDSVSENIEEAVKRSEGMDKLVDNIERIAEKSVTLRQKAEKVLHRTGYARCMIILMMIFCVVFMISVCVGILLVKYVLIPYLQNRGKNDQNTTNQNQNPNQTNQNNNNNNSPGG